MTITEYDIKVLTATAAGRWAYAAKRIESDLPGVSFLRLEMRTSVGAARIEVYSDRREHGAASLIVGGLGHLITPDRQMRDAFRSHGCADIYADHT